MTIEPQSHRQSRIRSLGVLTPATIMLTACGLFAGDYNDRPSGEGIVHTVVQAPVAPDGRVAGRITDLVLTLDVPLDPKEPGFTLRRGDQIRVTLPAAFEKNQDLPLLSIFDCIPQFPRCDTVVLLLGWPQGAMGAPPPVGYELRYEGSHTLVVAATEHLPADPPSNPGLKQIHLLLNSFSNPPPGDYRIGVELVTGDDVKQGAGRIRILPDTRPFIAVTNAMHENFANGDFQQTTPGSLTELPFDFLLWNDEGEPFEGITIEEGRMVQNNQVVGRVSIATPNGATGQDVFTRAPSATADAPVTGIPAGHLRVFFRAGSATGEYIVTFALTGGNAVQMTVRVM